MRWRGFLATVAVGAAVSAVGVSPALAATTWTVDPAGNDVLCPITHVCRHISVAVFLAAPGDTINVHKGLYNESVTIDKRLTLNGATRPALVSNCITTAASPAFDTVVDPLGGPFVFDIEADKVSVKGFVLQNAESRRRRGQLGRRVVLGVHDQAEPDPADQLRGRRDDQRGVPEPGAAELLPQQR